MTKEPHITKELLLGQLDTIETNFEEGYKRILNQIEFFRKLVKDMYERNFELYKKGKECEERFTELAEKIKKYEETGR